MLELCAKYKMLVDVIRSSSSKTQRTRAELQTFVTSKHNNQLGWFVNRSLLFDSRKSPPSQCESPSCTIMTQELSEIFWFSSPIYRCLLQHRSALSIHRGTRLLPPRKLRVARQAGWETYWYHNHDIQNNLYVIYTESFMCNQSHFCHSSFKRPAYTGLFTDQYTIHYFDFCPFGIKW